MHDLAVCQPPVINRSHGGICNLSLRVRAIGVFNHAPVTVSRASVSAAVFSAIATAWLVHRLTKSFTAFLDFGLCYSGTYLNLRLLYLIVGHFGGCETIG
jgi:hypothetical protein